MGQTYVTTHRYLYLASEKQGIRALFFSDAKSARAHMRTAYNRLADKNPFVSPVITPNEATVGTNHIVIRRLWVSRPINANIWTTHHRFAVIGLTRDRQIVFLAFRESLEKIKQVQVEHGVVSRYIVETKTIPVFAEDANKVEKPV